MANEIFASLKGIVEYGDHYAVSNFGNVKNVNTGRILKPYLLPDPIGYYQVTLSLDGNKKHYTIHRLVALAFLQNPDNKPEVNHRDGVKTNNQLYNLEWVTSSENQVHAVEHNLQTFESIKGSHHVKAQLNEEKVLKIRELYASGRFTHQQLANMFGTGKRNITQIINRKTWKHI